MQSYARTDIGKLRAHNQDYIYSSSDAIGTLKNLFVVADGMGGHKAGDYASRFAVEELTFYVEHSATSPVIPMLKKGIEGVNRRLYSRSLNSEDLSGMGTTLVIATVEDTTLYVANVGDSRLYLFRDQALIQITRDHSYVEEMVSLGKLERNSKEYLEKKNIITRAIGADTNVDIDFFDLVLQEQDLILLCSDGLTNMLDDYEMTQILLQKGTLEEKTEQLIQNANQNGGRDNISVILIEPRVSEVIPC
ncbi:MAG: Stp1/IreP family PP2C-type Ser/Thr phosphatase [Hungatella sp.]